MAEAKRDPYYKHPVVVYREDRNGGTFVFRVEDLAGDSFWLPRMDQVMKFLQYHGCYGVRMPEMEQLRRESAGKERPNEQA